MSEKIKPILRKVDPFFWDWVGEIQNKRGKDGPDTASNKASKPLITKLITNFFMANPKIEQKIIGVEINKNG